MHDVSGELAAVHDPVEAIRLALEQGRDDPAQVVGVASRLKEIAISAEDASQIELARFVDTLAGLLEIAACAVDEHDPQAVPHELIDFVFQSLPTLKLALEDNDDVGPELQQRTLEAHENWGECLQLIMDSFDESWDAGPEEEIFEPSHDPGEEPEVGGDQIGLILTSLANQPEADPSPKPEIAEPEIAEPEIAEPEIAEPEIAEPEIAEPWSGVDFDSVSGESKFDGAQPVLDDVTLDPEIQEAYLDDAQRCLASIESSLLTVDNTPGNPQASLQQVCRELHTLKGASASVGLEKLAHFLHTVEDNLQESCDRDGPADVDRILQCVDLMRRQMTRLSGGEATADELPTQQPKAAHAPASTPERFVDSTPSSQDSVRVKSTQLDRLMDMLAELVMLRNRRESRVEQLKLINAELVHCVSRLRAYEEGCPATSGFVTPAEDHSRSKRSGRQQVSSLTEIANDLLDLGRNLRELYEPFGDENLAISRFIRQFRQELMQLRRVPIAGLFRRLQRAMRDAAKTDNKKVRMRLIGADVGLERSVQDQLYDALLHIVRNAVSHGIEPESERRSKGKDPAGTVTLEARGGSNMMVITVRDDGNGLDYDALRRRGVEMGLISVDRATTRSELARLIFHPGFSTQSKASELSGRGVGMDVVATTLDRLHSWVEVDSVPDEGTTIRLLIPLHSVIEHAMVFRSSNQEYALPTQFIKSAGPWDPETQVDFPIIPFASLCPGIHGDKVAQPQLLVIAQGWESPQDESESAAGETSESSERRLGILVDEIVGPEEVVVRPLPGLIREQRLIAGVTLSGNGDIMLLFDTQRLMECGLVRSRDTRPFDDVLEQSRAEKPSSQIRVLIVDDSRSSRRMLGQCLSRAQILIDEAADGFEALKLIRRHTYDIVFTDLEMPQMSGFDLVREIKSTESTSHIPVVMVSSRDEDVLQQKAMKLGVIEYLTKPVSEKMLKETLHRLKETK